MAAEAGWPGGPSQAVRLPVAFSTGHTTGKEKPHQQAPPKQMQSIRLLPFAEQLR